MAERKFKRCSPKHCGMMKPITAYHLDPTTKDGKKHICKACINKLSSTQAKVRRKKNPEEFNRKRREELGFISPQITMEERPSALFLQAQEDKRLREWDLIE